MRQIETKTRLVLKLNAAFSSLVGLDLILFNLPLIRWMGIQHDLILPIIGICLILFGAFVFWSARRNPFSLPLLRIIIIQDVGWVLGCALIVGADFFGLSSLGNVLVLLSAVIVGLLAFFQYRGWKRLADLQAISSRH